MNLRLVEYFVAVVDHGGVTNAAKALYIAQPSMSQAIRTLEHDLGVQLFDRSGRHLALTPEGMAFAVSARRILADVEQAKAKMRSARDLFHGRLDVAAISSLAVDPLPRLVCNLRDRHPGIIVNVLDPGGPAGVVDQVRRGTAELGLTDLPVKAGALEIRELWTREIALVLPPALAADLPDPVPVDALGRIPLVMEHSHTTGRTFFGETVQRAISHVTVECAHRQSIWELVRHGAGATLLPRGIAETELTGVVVRSLAPQLRLSAGIVLRPGPVSPASQAFLDIAERTQFPASERANSTNARPTGESAAGS
jgi:DNA-binding transcriptional LysR family regulator